MLTLSEGGNVMTVLTTTVVPDEFTARASQAFDYTFAGTSSFTLPEFQAPAGSWRLGLIVGPSGSGKSSLLKEHFGGPTPEPVWARDKAVVSHFTDPEDALLRMSSIGFNSVPSWCRPRHVLSNGEGHRVDLARVLQDFAVIDEFTSVVNREAARSTAVGVRRLVDRFALERVVLATCHYDVIPWLQPDWVFDVATGVTTPRGSLQRRPVIELEIIPASTALWPRFAPHHYLSDGLNKTANCWLALWDSVPVAFAASLAFPHPKIRNAYRGSRTVCLPDFQGLGIGVRLSDAIAELHVRAGKRYFSRTAHPRMGEYRERHPHWKPTDKNKRHRTNVSLEMGDMSETKHWTPDSRVCYSHEYIL